MKQVHIKYNPYKLETQILVEGKELAQNSLLAEKSADGCRMQEWVEELPQILMDELNDTDFVISFHGTLLDYEDLADALSQAQQRGEISVRLDRIPAKETSDKEILIDAIFEEIQNGPFHELRSREIVNAFEQVKGSDFEVCVVGTMSSGKSTTINAMLGSKLMPSKLEACTAIVTRIKDSTSDNIPFKAEVYNKEGQLMETHQQMTYPIMERLNSDDSVSLIRMEGNIPFVESNDVSLVLVDTPGPDNARNPKHRKVQSELLSKSSKALVLYIMTSEFGTDDDNALLHRVAESMSVGGKQSKDRFIFVVNKMDERKQEDGATSQSLERVRSYLRTHGIAKPNLFPASALTALNLRLMANQEKLDWDTIDETEVKVKKLNRNPELHFETFAQLPPSVRGEINGRLEMAESNWDGHGFENPEAALVHTGIVSVEACIRQYVQKYAKTAKIKNIADTFMHKLDEVGCFEETKRELAQNRNESERIVTLINQIKKKMDSARDAKKFKDTVDATVRKTNDASSKVINDIIKKFQSRITSRIDDLRDRELTIREAEEEVDRLLRFAKHLEPDFQADLDELIGSSLIQTSQDLLDAYKEKLAALTDEIDFSNLHGIKIDPLKLMGGNLSSTEFSIRHLVREEDRVVGKESYEEKIQTRGWFESWCFWPKSEYVTRYRDIHKTVQYIKATELAQELLQPVERQLYDNGSSAGKYALQQTKFIAERFNREFARLNDILKAKLSELEQYATDRERAEERVRESKRKLVWLESIRAKVESILDI